MGADGPTKDEAPVSDDAGDPTKKSSDQPVGPQTTAELESEEALKKLRAAASRGSAQATPEAEKKPKSTAKDRRKKASTDLYDATMQCLDKSLNAKDESELIAQIIAQLFAILAALFKSTGLPGPKGLAEMTGDKIKEKRKKRRENRREKKELESSLQGAKSKLENIIEERDKQKDKVKELKEEIKTLESAVQPLEGKAEKADKTEPEQKDLSSKKAILEGKKGELSKEEAQLAELDKKVESAKK
ncbi:MAG TPA: hypothetical protein VJ205_01735, partial [Gammaproteobacteria bacterium]|nr:hypothetical protein [Gammaproteobacteria bacterium]